MLPCLIRNLAPKRKLLPLVYLPLLPTASRASFGDGEAEARGKWPVLIILLGGPPQNFQASKSPPGELAHGFTVLLWACPFLNSIHMPLLSKTEHGIIWNHTKPPGNLFMSFLLSSLREAESSFHTTHRICTHARTHVQMPNGALANHFLCAQRHLNT